MNIEKTTFQAEPSSSNCINSNITEPLTDNAEFQISKVYDIQIRKDKNDSKKSVLFENTMQKTAYFQFHSSDPDELKIMSRASVISGDSQEQNVRKLVLDSSKQLIELMPGDKIKLGLLFLKRNKTLGSEIEQEQAGSQLMIFAITFDKHTNKTEPYRNILFNVKYE